jgi:hypothetical protein
VRAGAHEAGRAGQGREDAAFKVLDTTGLANVRRAGGGGGEGDGSKNAEYCVVVENLAMLHHV